MYKPAVHVSTIVLAALLAFPADARAADDEPAPVTADQPEEPQPIREQDLQPVRGVRYRVWMKTGRPMEGVVRAKGVFEVLTFERGYLPADEDQKGAGIRLWFPQAQDGFIFVPLSDVERLEELGELSANEGRKIQRARLEAAHRAERERFRIKAIRAAEQAAAEAETAEDETDASGEKPATADDGGRTATEPITGKEVDAGKMAALLLEFPPTRWTVDSPKEIERRKVVLGLFPSDEEKRFLAVYDDWKKAYEVWAKATKTSEQGGAGDGSADDAGDTDGTARAR